MNNQSENDVVSCPYNRSHKVVRSRLLWHIQKCKAPQTIKSQFGHCKYNYLHIIEKTALSMHEDCECVDRPKKLERRDDCGDEGLKDEAFKQWKKQQNKEKRGKKLNNVHEASSEIQNEPLDFEVASNLQQSQINQSNMSVLSSKIEQSRLDSTLEVDQSQSQLNESWLKNNDNKAKRGYKPTDLLENLVKEEDKEDLDSDQQEDSDEEEIQMKKIEEIKKKKQKEIEQFEKEEQLQKKAEQSFYNNNVSQDLSFQVGFRPSLKKKLPSTPSDSHDSDEDLDLSFEKHVQNKNKKHKSSGSSSNNNSKNNFEDNKDASDDDSDRSYGQKQKKQQDKLNSSNSDSDSDNVVDSDDEEAIEKQKNQFNNSYVSRNNNTSIVAVEQSLDAIQQMQKSFCQNKDGKDHHFQPQQNSHHQSKKSVNESSQIADVSLDNQSFQSKISVHEHPQKHEQKQYQQRQEKRQQQDEEDKNKGEQSKYRRKFVNPHNLCEEDSKRIKELQADLDATSDILSVPGTRGNRGERQQRSEQNNQQQQRGNQRQNRDNNQQRNQRVNRDGNPFLQGRDEQNNTNISDNWPVSSHEESYNRSFTSNSFQQETIQSVQDGGRNNKRSKRTNY